MKTVFVGAGRGCRAVLELVVQQRLATLSLEILGVLDLDPEAPGMQFAREQGWPRFRQLEELLALPGLELVIELTGNDAVRESIYSVVPKAVRVMDHRMARVFWDLDAVAQHLRDELSLKTELEAAIREDRRRLQEILDGIPDAVMVVNEDSRIERVNRRFETQTGLGIAEVGNERCRDRVCRGTLGSALFDELCPREHALRSGRPITVVQRNSCIGVAGPDEERYFEVSANPIRDPGGSMSVVVTSRDVTEQVTEERRLTQELLQSQKLEAMGKLAAGVAHELNNPLTGILTFAEELAEELAGQPAVEDLQVIVRETLRCRQIVRDLLDYSRQTPPDRKTLPLASILHRVLALVAKQATFHNVRFDQDLGQGELNVRVDPNQMQQVLLNLIINARDAMAGSGTITLRAGVLEEPARVTLDVIDTGCGIPPENLGRIFEPFFSTKGSQGNGLGLSAVRSIMEQHGGTVTVCTEAGRGSSFRLTLPATQPAEPRAEGGRR